MSGLIIAGRTGQTLLEALRSARQPVDAPCGGRARCLKCFVRVEGAPAALAPPSPHEAELVGATPLAEGWRLACQARFGADGSVPLTVADATIDIPDVPVSEAQAARLGGAASAVPDAGLVMAVDIGTTTVVAVLARRGDGAILARAAEANAQRAWGSDVIARIEAAVASPEALTAMRAAIQRQIERLLLEIAGRRGLDPLPPVYVCGNTTMLHLLEGADLRGLAALPFQPAFLDSRPGEIGDSRIPVRLVAGISAFVGADILAGLFACGLDGAVDRPHLLVDIGTNGEMALVLPDRILVTATAAGPAFEGATISCGSIATAGAIDHVWIEDGAIRFSTIGRRSEPHAVRGVCGSGLLDTLACLRRLGLVDEYGGFSDDCEDGFAFGDGLPTLTQGDVRALQLAKGAIAAGIDLLCRRAGIEPADIGRVHLAGGFGSTLLPASALDIGLLPAALAGRIETAGNTALTGTLLLSMQPDAVGRMHALRDRAEVIDLAREPGFQDAFMDAMLFPEIDDA